MSVAALIIAVVSLAVAYFAWSRTQALGRDLTRTQEDLQHVRGELTETHRTLEGRLDDLCREARRQAGDLKFLPSMTIADAMQMHPAVAQVLNDFHLGGCSNCEVSDVDTLEGACRSYGIDQDALMKALNRLLSEPADSGKPIKVGKMRVEF